MNPIRRRRMTHGQLVRSELGESADHLRQAATYAAGGIGTVGPRVTAAREYIRPEQLRNAAASGWETTVATLAPFALAAKEGAQEARKRQAKQLRRLRREQRTTHRRWPALLGLLAAGTAVGAAGAIVIRRRRGRQWDEYGLTEESMADSTRSSMNNAIDRTATGVDRAMSSTARGVDTAADKATTAVEKGREKATSATDTVRRGSDQAADKAEDMIGRAGTPSRNSRS